MKTQSSPLPESSTSASAIGSGHVKHTPGPWHAATSEHYTLGGDQVEVVLLDGEGMVTDQICSVLLDTDNESQTGWRRQEADARLIAAAPDLLEALKAVVAIADRKTDEFDRARAAIQKASGQNAPHEPRRE